LRTAGNQGVKRVKSARILIVMALLMFFAAACSNYSVNVRLKPYSVKPGSGAEIIVHLDAGMGWKIDPNSMVMIKLTSPEDIFLEKRELFGEDRLDDNTFSTKLRVAENASAGPRTIGVEAVFSICREDRCKLVKYDKDFSLKVR